MKQATILLSLSKDHQVHKQRVTPIEAMILTAEHHRNAGGDPIVVDTTTLKDTERKEVTSKQLPDGRNVEEEKWVPDNRTDDQEVDRLKNIYGPKKVNLVLGQVRTLPKDFKEASQKGVTLSTGVGLGSQPNAATIAEVKLV